MRGIPHHFNTIADIENGLSIAETKLAAARVLERIYNANDLIEANRLGYADVAAVGTAAKAITGLPGLFWNYVFEGDSCTVGLTQVPYPNQVSTLFGGNIKFTNVATGGNGVIDQMLPEAATQVDVLIDTAYRKNVAVLWGGINDLTSNLFTVQEMYDAIEDWCLGRSTAGFDYVLVFTTHPFYGSTQTREDLRVALNTMLRAGWSGFADALIDVALDPIFPAFGETPNAVYMLDNIHLKTPGYAVVAGFVRDAIEAL